ncbi:MAG: D-2-hydroxyacid dehydrogenase [Hyphomonas sp.]
MREFLVHETTFARIAPRLKSYDADFDIVLVNDAGDFFEASTHEPVEAPRPQVAYGNVDVWFGPSARHFIRACLGSDRLEWFQSSAAGVDNAALKALGRSADFYTTNHLNAEAIGEWALWQALDWLKRGPGHRTAQANKQWKRLRQREICGSRWAIVGYGSIGEAIGKRASALGAVVRGVRRSSGPANGAEQIIHPDELASVAAWADIVVFCMPQTPETEGMGDAAFFANMRADSLFINVGRGNAVDEVALITALDAGAPEAAVLDVTCVEPLPEDSPLWLHPAVTITPHDSADTFGTIVRADDTFFENLKRFLEEKPLHNLIEAAAFET